MINSIRIIPAILTEDAQKLREMLEQTASFTDYVQIDIMDGLFVPSRSISREQIAGIPRTIGWEAHLMVMRPEKKLESFKQAGARKVIFHYEATSTPGRVISLARKSGIEIGMAVNPETTVGEILPFTNEVDSVLFLSVHPGFYGARFIPEVLIKVAELHAIAPGLRLGIDGGVKESNIVEIARSGVNEICVGSAIFLQPRPVDSYRKLLKMVQGL